MQEILRLDISGLQLTKILKSLEKYSLYLDEEFSILVNSFYPALSNDVIADIIAGKKEIKGDSTTNFYLKNVQS